MSTNHHALGQLLEDRCGGRVLRIFGEHVKTQKNNYCQLEEVDHKEVVIEGNRLINFNAIDYLGLEYHPEMIRSAQEASARWGTQVGSARAAAEMAGYQELEDHIAELEKVIAQDEELSGRFPERWLAIKLLEEDSEILNKIGVKV